MALTIPAFAQPQNALYLNGGNFAPTPNDAVSGAGDFTVEFWAYVPTLATDGPHQFLSQGAVGSTFGFSIGYDGANSGHIMVGETWTDTGIPLPEGKWVHIAVVYDASVTGAATLYLNGVAVQSTFAFGILSNTGGFNIGGQTDGTQLMNGSIDELRVWSIARSPQDLKAGMFTAVDPSTTGLEAYYTMNETGGASTKTIANASVAGTALDGTLTGTTTAAWVASPIQVNTNALSFSGAHDRVDIPNATGTYDLSDGTVEFWVNPITLTGTSTVFGNRGPGGVRYSFEISPTTIGITSFGGSGTIPYTFTPGAGNWYHLAFVSSGGITTVFVNGIQQPTTITSSLGGSGSPANQPVTIGLAVNNTPGTDDSQNFTGTVDELRVWNAPRSAGDISTFMNYTMAGSEPNLVGLFNFDQGIPGGDNAGMLTAFDFTSNNNHGTLNSFTGLVSGTASNFITGQSLAPAPLPVILSRFTAFRQDNQVLLQWQTDQEENSRDFTIERSVDGTLFTAIGTVAAAGTSNKPRQYAFTDPAPAKNANYYRLKQTDLDGAFTISPVKRVVFSITGRLIWYTTGKSAVEVYLQQGNNEFYTLTDLNGHTLRKGQLSAGRTDISGFPPGLYIVNVQTATGAMMNTKVLLP
jgi:hypothetical protein